MQLIDTCQRSVGWFRQFMKDAGDFAGAYMLSMVRAHYPRVDFNRFLLGYPEKVGPDKAAELRNELYDLSSQLLRDVDLSGLPPPQPQGRLATTAGSSSSSAAARPLHAISISHAGGATSSMERPSGQGGAEGSAGPQPPTS